MGYFPINNGSGPVTDREIIEAAHRLAQTKLDPTGMARVRMLEVCRIATNALDEVERLRVEIAEWDRMNEIRRLEAKYMKLAEGRACESCGSVGTTVGCHFNIGKGGTGYRVLGAIAWLCRGCHDIVDGRATVTDRERRRVLERIIQTMGVERFNQWKEAND